MTMKPKAPKFRIRRSPTRPGMGDSSEPPSQPEADGGGVPRKDAPFTLDQPVEDGFGEQALIYAAPEPRPFTFLRDLGLGTIIFRADQGIEKIAVPEPGCHSLGRQQLDEQSGQQDDTDDDGQDAEKHRGRFFQALFQLLPVSPGRLCLHGCLL